MSLILNQPLALAASLLAALLMLLPGCGGNAMPDPSGPDVRGLVLDVSANLIRSALLPGIAATLTGMAPDVLAAQGYPPLDFETWKNKRAESPVIEQAVKQIEEATGALEMELRNIRVENRDEALRRVTCLGDLAFTNGNTIAVRYQAQYTEDGRLYVEAELLE